MMSNRIIGIDVARAIAIFGMVIINFKLSFGIHGNPFFEQVTDAIQGKAAALFVVLAGVGIALMTNSSVDEKNHFLIKSKRIELLKKALFLLIIGLLFYPIWFADILHFYGFYMVIAAMFITQKRWTILYVSFVIIGLYPFLLIFFDYDIGWNYTTFEYQDFWTISGFLRNLLFNGFHPLLPWVSFILIGLWFGKQNLKSPNFIKKAFWASLGLYLLNVFISYLIQTYFMGTDAFTAEELVFLFGTEPMPPLPFYMVSASALAIAIISGSVWASLYFSNHPVTKALKQTGQLALTIYVAHVLVGIGFIELLNPSKLGLYPVEFSVLYGMGFCFLSVLLSSIWLRYFEYGPLEWVMRRLTKS